MIVDLSAFQRGISWDALAAGGVRAAILKATEGVGFEDAAFEHHRAEARRLGIAVGAYHFARPDTVGSERDALAEADWFLHVAELREGDLLPALDLETPGSSRAALAAWAAAWLERVGAAIAERPLLYTYPSFCRERLETTGELAERALLWLAAWGPNDGARHAAEPIGAWSRIALHQYTSRGSVPGVRGALDLNHIGEGFSLDALRVGRAHENKAGYGPPWRVEAGGNRLHPDGRSWLEPAFQARARRAARGHPFIVIRGTRR